MSWIANLVRSEGPNAGKWATEFVRPSTRAALEARIRDGDGTVYVKR